MTKLESLRYAMFVRIGNFGKSHRGQFPESSPAGQAFVAVVAAAEMLDTHASAKRLAGEASQKTKANIRRAIRRRLTLVGRADRLVASRTQGGTSRFGLPADQSVHALLDAARTFVRDGQADVEQFVPLGVPATIIADLRALLDRHDEADRRWHGGTGARAAATDGMNAATQAAFDAIRTLDVVVPNTAEDNPALAASWKLARRTSPKVKPAASAARPAVDTTQPAAPADQPPVSTPAPTAPTVGPVAAPTAVTNDGLRKVS